MHTHGIECPCSQGEGSVVVMILIAVMLLLAYRLIVLLRRRKMENKSGEARAGAGPSVKVAIVVLLAIGIGVVIYLKTQEKASDANQAAIAAGSATQPAAGGASGTGLPRLVDLGAGQCIPCKMMAPILERLQKEYRDSLEVVVIDVWKDPGAAQSYRIRVIPTQIFYDASGRELFRHEGFLSREEILKKWRELGIDLSPKPTAQETGDSDKAADKDQQHSPAAPGSGEKPPDTGKTDEKAQQEPSKTEDPKKVPGEKADNTVGKTVESAYPGLSSGALAHAKLGDLPEGTLLRAGEITISAKELDSKIDEAPAALREQLRKNRFFLLEQIGTEKLLLATAKKDAAEKKKDLSGKTDREIIQQYLESLVSTIQVTDKEIVDFYEENKSLAGGTPLEQLKDQIKDYLLGQKRQQAVYKHILTLGERVSISVSASWVKEQAVLAKDNPVDKARASGKPTLVEFGASGCVPCDMMQPILDALRKKYGEKVNIIFVHVGNEQILGARYSIQAIPVQVFFDKDGKEFFRHIGFFPQEEVEKKLTEMGVK